VLIVEDESFLRCDLADCLREAGFVVMEAASADRAMAVCKDGMAVHILIADIQLNDSASGWDVAEAFRAVWGDVAVISTSGDSHDRTRSVPNSLYFSKPYQPTTLSGHASNSWLLGDHRNNFCVFLHSWHNPEVAPTDVRFSNRPFGVKHFQTVFPTTRSKRSKSTYRREENTNQKEDE
jgi:CheY-like chemotaxis protein